MNLPTPVMKIPSTRSGWWNITPYSPWSGRQSGTRAGARRYSGDPERSRRPVTYHGPGQQVMYVLLNLKRRKLGVRELVTLLEQTVVNTPAEYSIESHPAPTPLASMSANAKSALWDCGSVKVVLSTVWRLISPWISHRFAYQPLRLCRYGDDANAPVAAGSLPETVAPRLVANLLALLNHPPHEYLPGIKRQAIVPLSAGR